MWLFHSLEPAAASRGKAEVGGLERLAGSIGSYRICCGTSVVSLLVSDLPSICCSDCTCISRYLTSLERYQIGEPVQILSKLGVNAPPLSQSNCGNGESDPSAATVDPCLVLSVAKLCPGFALKQALRQRKRKTPAQHMSMQPAIKSTVSLEKAKTSPFTKCMDCSPICEAVG